jgi:hypothetical protein
MLIVQEVLVHHTFSIFDGILSIESTLHLARPSDSLIVE